MSATALLNSAHSGVARSPPVSQGQPPSRVSADFPRTAETDLVFQSDDGVLFHTRSSHIFAYSTWFATTYGPVVALLSQKNGFISAVTVTLDVPSSVLTLLVSHMRPTPPPSLSFVDWMTLRSLANVAERCKIFVTMDLCRRGISLRLDDQPFDVLLYAIEHGYHDLAASAADKTLNFDDAEAREALPRDILFRWLSYKSKKLGLTDTPKWIDPPILPHLLHTGGLPPCSRWDNFESQLRAFFHPSIKRFDLAAALKDKRKVLNGCVRCVKRFKVLHKEYQDNGAFCEVAGSEDVVF